MVQVPTPFPMILPSSTTATWALSELNTHVMVGVISTDSPTLILAVFGVTLSVVFGFTTGFAGLDGCVVEGVVVVVEVAGLDVDGLEDDPELEELEFDVLGLYVDVELLPLLDELLEVEEVVPELDPLPEEDEVLPEDVLPEDAPDDPDDPEELDDEELSESEELEEESSSSSSPE